MMITKTPTNHPAATMSRLRFTKLCLSVWGPNWKKPASRVLGRDSGMMRRYASGETSVPADVAAKLLIIANIGPAGQIIKSVVLNRMPARIPAGTKRASMTERSHIIASEAVAALMRAGLIRPEDQT